jgi:hypothetical protein
MKALYADAASIAMAYPEYSKPPVVPNLPRKCKEFHSNPLSSTSKRPTPINTGPPQDSTCRACQRNGTPDVHYTPEHYPEVYGKPRRQKEQLNALGEGDPNQQFLADYSNTNRSQISDALEERARDTEFMNQLDEISKKALKPTIKVLINLILNIILSK